MAVTTYRPTDLDDIRLELLTQIVDRLEKQNARLDDITERLNGIDNELSQGGPTDFDGKGFPERGLVDIPECDLDGCSCTATEPVPDGGIDAIEFAGLVSRLEAGAMEAPEPIGSFVLDRIAEIDDYIDGLRTEEEVTESLKENEPPIDIQELNGYLTAIESLCGSDTFSRAILGKVSEIDGLVDDNYKTVITWDA